MDPVVHALGAAGGLVLRDLALVVREHQVHAAAVDVELPAEVLLPHHGALQMPAREAFAPRGRPAHDVLRLGLLPDGEVVRGALVGLAVQGARPFQGRLQGPARQHAVAEILVVLLHVEIDRPVGLVGVARREDLLHGLDLLDDMAGGTRLDGRGLHVQQTHGLVVALGVGLDHFHGLQILEFRLLRDLVLAFVRIVLQMAHVGDVPHVADLVAEVLEKPEKDVVCNARTGVAEMRVPIDGRAADVHAHVARMDGHEELLAARQGIGQKEISHKKSSL